MDEHKLYNEDFLNRKYYEYDNGFYANRISLSCFEQGKYQSLRKWDMDYFLVFCDDINMEFRKSERKLYLKTHNLHFNDKLCSFKCVTKNYKQAETCIEQILKNGNLVVFRTAMDYLHTYTWHRDEEPYVRTQHRSIIVGYDEKDYFYIDIPQTRNSHFYRAHPLNPSVGCINRKELLDSFQYFCEIGYMEVNTRYINKIADINKIVSAIVKNYYCLNDDKSSVFIGRQAIEQIAQFLKNDFQTQSVFLDEFIFELFASRSKILKICLCTYKFFPSPKEEKRSECLLEEIANKWEIIRNIVIKNEISPQRNIGVRIADIIETGIIPLMETLIKHLKAQCE